MLVQTPRLLLTNQRHQETRYRPSVPLEVIGMPFLDPSLESPCPLSLVHQVCTKAPSWLPQVLEWPATTLAKTRKHCPHKICLHPLPPLPIAARPLGAPNRLVPSVELPHLHPCHRSRRESRPQSRLL